MADPTPSTRDRLIHSGVTLFQERGFHGTSVADILTAAQAPKGSLYHHFPAGKADLARAAAHLASDLMLDIIARAYDPAEDFSGGTVRMCEKLARLFERQAHWRACPVQTLFLDGPLDRAEGERLLQSWIDATQAQGLRLHGPAPLTDAQRIWATLIGCWTFARIRGDAAPLRNMPDLLTLGETRSA
ncbi:TetR/AcrR family transcriptional regulator [Jannaschia donghaensis]|uniref:Putative HTH-type transcriptional regulator YxaF n=1 Tax=Jannaschia donghaensis TaxID=420998 RepID=A0A0M6YJW4_9RHOB|nr:TetR/AcrR family transcriptional regulator [Jannaschia donghaensis]CTQ49803.1 putative HTH-type transcriptional regulator YxaF [Jannaschia donghaensis]